MGLDIYVYRTKNWDKYKETLDKINKAGKASEAVWEEHELSKGKSWNDIAEADRDVVSAAAKEAEEKTGKELGLKRDDNTSYPSWLNPYEEDLAEEKSKKHPKHELFNLGYFRSSYNGSGINSILTDRVGYSLYEIFEYNDDDEYEFTPNWIKVKKNALEAKAALKKAYKESGNVGVYHVSSNMFSPDAGKEVNSDAKALEVYREEMKANGENGGEREPYNYSNIKGEFMPAKPLNVRALIHGVEQFGGARPATYVVFELDKGTPKFYLDALDIIAETAEMAIDDKEYTYYLHWSG